MSFQPLSDQYDCESFLEGNFVDVYAWFNLTSYHPPPQGIPPGICKFFPSWWSTFPSPGAQKEQISLRVFSLVTKCELFKNIPKQAHLPKAIKIQPVSNILHSVCNLWKPEENGTKTLLRLCRSAFHRKPSWTKSVRKRALLNIFAS